MNILETLGMDLDDAMYIEEMCEDKGIEVKTMLKQLLNDLVDNEHSGGSDERMLAQEWFHRSF